MKNKIKSLLCALLILVLPLALWADQEEAEVPGVDKASKTFEDGLKLEILIDNEKGYVGKLSTINILATKNGHTLGNVRFAVGFYHREDKLYVYKNNFFTKNGKLEFKHQFFDGAQHEIRVKALSSEHAKWKAMELAMTIDVQGYQPPTGVLLKTLFFLVSIAGVGMVLGYALSFIKLKPKEKPDEKTKEKPEEKEIK